MRVTTQPPWLVPSAKAFSTPRASITCKAMLAESQYVNCSVTELVAPWPSGSIARKLTASVRDLLLNCSLNRDEVVHIELMRTTVGFAASMRLPDNRYPALIPPRWGTWMVVFAAMLSEE